MGQGNEWIFPLQLDPKRETNVHCSRYSLPETTLIGVMLKIGLGVKEFLQLYPQFPK